MLAAEEMTFESLYKCLDGQSCKSAVRCQMSMSKTFMGGAVCREFESGVLPAEEMLDRVVCSFKHFSFQMCLESGDGSGTFCNWRGGVPDSWCRDTEFFRLEVDACPNPYRSETGWSCCIRAGKTLRIRQTAAAQFCMK